jgi:hypothetical protein
MSHGNNGQSAYYYCETELCSHDLPSWMVELLPVQPFLPGPLLPASIGNGNNATMLKSDSR